MCLNPEFRTCIPETRAHLEVCQQPDISRDLMCRCTETRQRCQDVDVDLARICLGCDRVGVLESAQLGDALIQRLHLCVVAIKESQETRLSTRRSLCTAEPKVISCPFEVPKVPKEFLSVGE